MKNTSIIRIFETILYTKSQVNDDSWIKNCQSKN